MLSTLTFTKPPYIALSDELCTRPRGPSRRGGRQRTEDSPTPVPEQRRGRGEEAPHHHAGLEPARDGAMRSYTGPPIKASTLARSRGFHDGLPISLAHWPALSSPRTSEGGNSTRSKVAAS